MSTPIYGALVFNWRDQTHTLRPLRGCTALTLGRPSSNSDEAWDEAEGSWDSATQVWDLGNAATSPRSPLLANSDGLYQAEQSMAAFDVPREVERRGIALPANLRESRPDVTSVKLIRAVYLKAEVPAEGDLELYVGGQYALDDEPSWQGPFLPSFQTQYKVDCTVSGRFLALRFVSTAEVAWRLWSAEIDYEIIAKY